MSVDVPKLDEFPELLPDSRVERLWDKLRRELKLPDNVEFATYEQPPQWADDPKTGLRTLRPAQAFFLVVSPNPHPRHKGRLIKSFAFCRLDGWREAEDEAWRFAGAGDPAEPIFRALSRKHLAEIKSWKELN